jgi:aryl-alcohol dehydrogenase-like predicted oxidoreductase
LKSPDQIPDGDIRKFFPRFSAENLTASNQLAEQLQQLAKSKGGTGAQLALGCKWLFLPSPAPVVSLCNKLYLNQS